MTTLRFNRPKAAGRSPLTQSEAMPTVVSTKVQVPNLRDDAIARGRLLDSLRELVERFPLLAVSAPPGYGKTTTLASLPLARPDARVAWLSIHEEDNEASHFLAGLAASLSTVGAGPTDASRIVLNEPRGAIDSLINELDGPRGDGVVVVLDDLHRVEDPTVLGCVVRFVERLPRSMRVAVGTRHEPSLPLARFRARRSLGEIRQEDLAFTLEEARDFLSFAYRQDVLHRDWQELIEEAEGWAAGLTLLASSVSRERRGAADVDTFFAQEVLAALDPELANFLLETSILPELTPALCRSVTDRTNSQSLLEEIVRRNVFVKCLEASKKRYRYHGLFRGFLERRLVEEKPESVPDLLQRMKAARPAVARAKASLRVPETGSVLTTREIEVLHLVALGASNAEIAGTLFISVHTVKRHVASLLDKLGANSRSRAAAAARRLGLVP